MLYDCFTFFNELDLLDVRLHELNPVVDFFVLVEARETFQGNPKPLYFAENASRFRNFADKIIHVIVEFPSANEAYKLDTKPHNRTWAREHYQRNQIARGLVTAHPEDLIIVSDVDEILCEKVLRRSLAKRERTELTIFEMPMYRGSANRRLKGVSWDKGPRLIEYKQFPGAQRLRMTKATASARFRGTIMGALHARAWNWVNTGVAAPIGVVTDAGWHITSMGNWDTWQVKLSSYSHLNMKKHPSYQSQEDYDLMIANESDVVGIEEMPAFIRENPDRFVLS